MCHVCPGGSRSDISTLSEFLINVSLELELVLSRRAQLSKVHGWKGGRIVLVKLRKYCGEIWSMVRSHRHWLGEGMLRQLVPLVGIEEVDFVVYVGEVITPRVFVGSRLSQES